MDSSDPEHILHLQRTIGNYATARLLQPTRNKTTGNGFAGLKMASGTSIGIVQRDPDPDDTTSAMAAPRKKRSKAKKHKPDAKDKARLAAIMEGELATLHTACEEFDKKARITLRNVASEVLGSELLIGPVKALDRIEEKAVKKVKAGGVGVATVSHDIKDILRATLIFDDFDQLKTGYNKAIKTLQGYSVISGFTKMTEMFGEGEEAASGYRDAKVIFRMLLPLNIRKILAKLMYPLTELSVELQFNTRAALAVKEGALPGSDPGDEWHFTIDTPDGGHNFDALRFLTKLTSDLTAKDTPTDGETQLIEEVNAFLDGAHGIPAEGLPLAHDLYEPRKVEAMGGQAVADRFNAIYQSIYDFAYRYNNFDGAKGAAMKKTVGKLKKYIKK